MWIDLVRAAILAFVMAFVMAFVLAAGLATVPAAAGELADFNAAVEKASAHNRVASGYLRTGNRDLALIEIGRLRTAWAAVVTRFAGKRPDAFDDGAQFGAALTDVSTQLVAADMMLNSGRLEAARNSLAAVRTSLSNLRRANGIVVLADCIFDANAAMQALSVYDDRALDWSKSETRFGVASKATIYGYELSRCDRIASEQVRSTAEFRRLIDGANAGLALVPKAIATRDSELLHRIIIELRSFDNLLAFRFG